MKVVNIVPPSAPENQADGDLADRVRRHDYTVTVFATCPEPNAAARPLLGRVLVRPGPVAPGQIAAVRTPGGSLQLRRIFYERTEGGCEEVRLEGLAPGMAPLRYCLSEVMIEGTVSCFCWADEDCPCADS